MDHLKQYILTVLAFFVFTLASVGEYANNVLEERIETVANSTQDEEESGPVTSEISIDIFNSVIHLSHLIFHSDLVFEFALPKIINTLAHSVFSSALNFTKYFKTLFHFIISPNAP